MKRRLFPLLLIVLALAVWLPGAARAGVQDFTIPVFEADYYLSRDAEHISHLQVNEHIVAQFPEADQNHGILRAIPKTYEGHSVSLKIQRVDDGAGRAHHFTTSTQNGNLVLKIGDADRYVHGRQTYNISYSLANVTTKPSSDRDGHFWDVNGDQWEQVFDQVTARVHLTPELASALQPAHARCFAGSRGYTTADCSVTEQKTPGAHAINFTATRPLTAEETLTYELSFAPGTFIAYTMPRVELIGLIANIVLLGLLPPVLALGFMVNRWRRFGRDPEGRGAIIAEYLPPKDLSVVASSVLLHEAFQPKSLSAQIIDLAVRHYLKIYEIKTKKLFGSQVSYEVELVQDPAKLRSEEKAVLDLLLGQNAVTSARVNLDSLKNKLYSGATALGRDVAKQLATAGSFRVEPSKAKLPYYIASCIIALVGFAAIILGAGIMAVGFMTAATIVAIAGQVMPARTAQGVRQREYLLGLKLYMRLAEADRLKVLQSPHGELTEKVDVNDTTALVKLYEKLLPYAMLFGIEKDWAKEFAPLYAQAPDWYSGSSSFNAGYFAGSLSSFSAASTASFTSPSSSGSGGSAGGGGGGGGGGGW